MSVRTRLVVPLIVLLAVACGGTSATSGALLSSPGPALSVHVYFLRGEKVASVHRDVPVAYGLGAAAAVRALLAGPTTHERAIGLSTTIPARSRLLGLAIKDGTANVNLSSRYESGGGSLSMTGRLMQVVYTLTQFSPVHRVIFRIDGKRVTSFGGEGVMLDHPVTRATYRSFLPHIFVDSPAIGETVNSPLTVHGLANVFEGQFVIQVTTGNGKVLTRKQVQASMGKYVGFTTTLRFVVPQAGPGRVTAFDYSAKDGSRIDVYSVPVVLR